MNTVLKKRMVVRLSMKVEYAVPGGLFSPLIHLLFVKRDVKMIFEYRQEKLLQIFTQQSENENVEK